MTKKLLTPRAERLAINRQFASVEELIAEYVVNISRSGVFIRSKKPLPIGTAVDLCFSVVMDDVETIEGRGEVVRVQKNPPGMGVVFTELTNYSQDLIAKLMTQRARKRAPR